MTTSDGTARDAGTDVGNSASSVRVARPQPGMDPVRDEELLMSRAAWAYYVEGLTQDEIARKFDLNRIRINRVLAQARERGIVQVRVNAPLSLQLEAGLERKFALKRALVVPTPDDRSRIPQSIAAAAGPFLSERLKEGMSIGVGWGRTLRLSVAAMEPRALTALSIVSLLGGLTQGSVMNTYETASRLADLYSANCFYIAAPAFADSETIADILRNQSSVRDAFEHARNIDVAFISVGSISDDSTMRRLRLITEADTKSLTAAGAVGDLCAFFIDTKGRVVDHPINRRVLALQIDDLRRVPMVILASGGDDKLDVLRAALSIGVVSVLVTDERTAEGLLSPKIT